MKQQLAELGYPADVIRHLVPVDAHYIIQHAIKFALYRPQVRSDLFLLFVFVYFRCRCLLFGFRIH
jgi:hypothetical protein